MPTIRSGPASHVYFSQRLRLHYVDWGNEGAPPMLLVHGGRDHCRNWDWVAEAFRDEYHIIAPDLRGHGDSQWSMGGSYTMPEYVYDIAHLVDQKNMAPITILSHSLGGMISLQYAGLYPNKVKSIIAIEGLGASPLMMAKSAGKSINEKLIGWADELRKVSGRTPRRYASLENAFKRMQDENPHLSENQARHLTVHGANQNEDGTYSWKFDNYVRIFRPYGLSPEEIRHLWSRITCPTLLIRGTESWASDPIEDGRFNSFQNANVASIDGAGHWAHHDRLDVFLDLVRSHLAK
ncbi:MAG: alpha/beta hydrolase [Alphaproteobacteria bacterium]|nr:alpha/beta hydrolase [Alphaproteobacteria bacterium]